MTQDGIRLAHNVSHIHFILTVTETVKTATSVLASVSIKTSEEQITDTQWRSAICKDINTDSLLSLTGTQQKEEVD